MKKIMVWLMILIALPAYAEVGEDAWAMCQPDSEVFVREFPSRGATIAARLCPGDHVSLTGKKRGRWYQVELICEAMQGWVRGDFLSFSEPETFAGGKEFITTRGKLVARFSINGRIRKKFKKRGVKVKVYLMADEWSVTSQGFIKTEFLEAVDEELRELP